MAVLTMVRHRFWDNAGNLAAGGKVYIYEAGTTTPKDSYTSSTGLSLNTWPVILDAKGEANIWTVGMFKINVTDSADVQITGYPVDNVGYDIVAASFSNSIHTATNKATPVSADEFGIWDSVSGLLNKLTYANLKAAVLTGTATAANRVDSGIVTIASSATTSDIFAAAANTIDWTGTATTTAFPAAPKAGMERTLVCAGACLFTAGANLEIEGVPIGSTITLAADAIVRVIAETTTHFKLTYSLSGTFTATATGIVGTPSVTASYSVTNGVVCLRIPQLAGTSNATSFTITGLPSSITTSAPINGNVILGWDNGATNYVATMPNVNGSVITLLLFGLAVSWTAANSKGIPESTITYKIA